jgi:lysozyme family protein
MSGFDSCFPILLKEEGGFVNNPKDPGGATNLGVTKKTWEAYIGHRVDLITMKMLTPEAVKPLYRSHYWDAVNGDNLPPAVALCAFDFGVNAGPGRAAKLLQSVIGCSADGQIGPGTLRALQAFATANGTAEVVRRYQAARRDYYRKLPTFGTFGKGWLARTDRIETHALRLTGAA